MSKQRRVLLAGIFHETHTFLPGTLSLDEFMIRPHGELLAAAGDGSPLGGFLEVANRHSWQVLPTVDYRATPGPTVDDTVFEQFWSEFRSRAEPELAQGVDGIFVGLHGAMVSSSFEDVEG